MDVETDDDDTAQYNLSSRNLAGLANQQHAQAQPTAAGQGQGAGADTKPVGGGHKRNSSEYSGDRVQ